MFISRLEHFASVDSTQGVVREWLADGTPPVCIAFADEQTAGRGRLDRQWVAPRGAALLVSAGFVPENLALRHGWRLGAVVAMAMLDAAEDVAGLRDEALGLKWPNDIVADGPDGRLVKVAGVLGETVAEGDSVATAVIGIGINADWTAADFPPELATSMSSLRELSGGRPIDPEVLLEAWLARLEPRVEALGSGLFDAASWSTHQRTTGRWVDIELGDALISGLAVGIEPESGALLVEVDGVQRAIDSGEVTRCRVIDDVGRRGRPA